MGKITDAELKKLVQELITKHHLDRDKGEILEHALHWVAFGGHAAIDLGESALAFLELSTKIAHSLESVTLLAKAGSGAGAGMAGGGVALATIGAVTQFLGGVLLAVEIALELKDATSLAYRYYGLYAEAYTITAWSFGYGIPQKSQAFLNKAKQALYPRYNEGLYTREWIEKSASTRRRLEDAAIKCGKNVLQAVLVGAAHEDPKKLCLAILSASAEKIPMTFGQREGFKQYFMHSRIVYPD